MTVRIGALRWNQYTGWPALLEAGRRADRLGYDSLWTRDHLDPIVVPPWDHEADPAHASPRPTARPTATGVYSGWVAARCSPTGAPRRAAPQEGSG